MKPIRRLVLVGVLPVLFFSCASFSYKYYGIKPSDGKLLGSTPAQDLPITVCEPDEQIVGKCVVLMIDEWERLRSDHVLMEEQLKDCQSSGGGH